MKLLFNKKRSKSEYLFWLFALSSLMLKIRQVLFAQDKQEVKRLGFSCDLKVEIVTERGY
jgi:hypothetical protein